MATLIDTLRGLLTPDLVSQASTVLGESQGNVSRGLSSALPAILAGLLAKSGDSGIMRQLMDLLMDRSIDPGAARNPGDLMGAGGLAKSPLVDLGTRFLSTIFGTQTGAVVEHHRHRRGPEAVLRIDAAGARRAAGHVRPRRQGPPRGTQRHRPGEPALLRARQHHAGSACRSVEPARARRRPRGPQSGTSTPSRRDGPDRGWDRLCSPRWSSRRACGPSRTASRRRPRWRPTNGRRADLSPTCPTSGHSSTRCRRATS